ncbi:response regulator containing a CheY-like receiver domain and an HTH DNA-binding domain [Pseudomonas sp. GM21]|jgi:LuxR family transcriptional regulator|uniref:autoinducer binding domain-containing protein n=1 Tax=unclassified Pseudomonas TaxID=196821 RepID=UPI00027247E5|nr:MULTISPECIES: autoinducer binding domain-containing protein [unclassified Pseudomonas]EJM17041.1 response regulator containing a CheY-like receiver domain and an HTH DNA-binding domain [Pseudomonas sp. GM21]MDR6928457.1 LuxR family transcriptional regulator [Pseudomonas sp. BE134]
MEMWKESQLRQISDAKEINSAYDVSLNLVQSLGFTFCAFSITSPAEAHHLDTVSFNNYPLEWNTKYHHDHFGDIDPIRKHCNQSELPILWEDELFSKAPQLRQAQKTLGLQYGWSQSIHDGNGLRSMFSLARSNNPITAYELYENLGYAIFINHQLHRHVAQKLRHCRPGACVPHLSTREIEILRLSADGKTAYECSRILSISERTINFHVHSAIQKFGVNNKIAAVIKAVRTGAI